MLRNNFNRQFRGANRRTFGRRVPLRAGIRRNTKSLNQSRVKKLPSRQLLSAPSHSYTLKLQKLFRIGPIAMSGTTPYTLTLGVLISQMRQELGITADPGVSENFAIHSGHAYATSNVALSATSAPELVVILFDIENVSSVIDNLQDIGSFSSIPNLHWSYPVNDRPTFSDNTTSTTTLLSMTTTSTLSSVQVYVDLLIDYTRVQNSAILFSGLSLE